MCSAGVLPKDKLIKVIMKSRFLVAPHKDMKLECKEFTVRRLHGENTCQQDKMW